LAPAIKPWLKVGKTVFRGRPAMLPLTILSRLGFNGRMASRGVVRNGYAGCRSRLVAPSNERVVFPDQRRAAA
jgi:hypothetical protein